jgi:hypothetical protein
MMEYFGSDVGLTKSEIRGGVAQNGQSIANRMRSTPVCTQHIRSGLEKLPLVAITEVATRYRTISYPPAASPLRARNR